MRLSPSKHVSPSSIPQSIGKKNCPSNLKSLDIKHGAVWDQGIGREKTRYEPIRADIQPTCTKAQVKRMPWKAASEAEKEGRKKKSIAFLTGYYQLRQVQAKKRVQFRKKR
ncbi:MAG: hypothetical protein J5846_10205 [Desulfovibrio sp.]|nr:hypothetical protein [Desulfovibrio sp.]